jgi:hypothetical protein
MNKGKYFDEQVKKAIKNMHPLETDPYREIQYSDSLFVHVGSHPDGAGKIEIQIIVPHDHNGGYDIDASEVGEIPNTDELYDDLIACLNEATTDDHSGLAFHLTEQVDDGAWERHANIYDSFTIETGLRN